jgi:RNA exonuclease 1
VLDSSTSVPAVPSVTVEEAVVNLNDRLNRLYIALPLRTAFIVFSGHSDPRKMTALNSRKSAFENALRMGKLPDEIANGEGGYSWKAQDGRDLEEEVEKAKRGLLFLSVKDTK